MTALLLTICLGADISGGARPMPPTYTDLRARVETGERITLSVGIDSPGAIRCDDSLHYGVEKGVYLCWLDGKTPRMQRIETTERPVINYIRNIGAAIVGKP